MFVTHEGSTHAQERPLLEGERAILLENIASDLHLLREMEDKSLTLLTRAEGHILDDQDLVENLQKSKIVSVEILERVKQSEEAEKQINLARKRYLPVLL